MWKARAIERKRIEGWTLIGADTSSVRQWRSRWFSPEILVARFRIDAIFEPLSWNPRGSAHSLSLNCNRRVAAQDWSICNTNEYSISLRKSTTLSFDLPCPSLSSLSLSPFHHSAIVVNDVVVNGNSRWCYNDDVGFILARKREGERTEGETERL